MTPYAIKPEGATHLENEKPPDALIEPGWFVPEELDALDAASLPDPLDEFLASRNFTPGMPSGGWQGVAIHTEEGWHGPSVEWLRNPVSQASAHACVRRDGWGTRLVRDSDRAWHAKAAGMFYLSIEHEGGSGLGTVPILWATPRDAAKLDPRDKMLLESARLCAYWCVKYGLSVQHDFGPLRRDTESVIAGHDQMLGNDHRDPGPRFPWKAYMNEVARLANANPPKPAPGTTVYRVRCGAFKERGRADALRDDLLRRGFPAVTVEEGGLWKVQAGAFGTLKAAENLSAKLIKAGYQTTISPSNKGNTPVKPKPSPLTTKIEVGRKYGFAIVGTRYEWGTMTVTAGRPYWAADAPAPSPGVVKRESCLCAGVGNLTQRAMGSYSGQTELAALEEELLDKVLEKTGRPILLPDGPPPEVEVFPAVEGVTPVQAIPRSGQYYGGTLAYWPFYEDVMEPFDPEEKYPDFSLLLRPFAAWGTDEGHVAILVYINGVAYVLQSYANAYGATTPGVTAAVKLADSNRWGNGNYYKGIVVPGRKGWCD